MGTDEVDDRNDHEDATASMQTGILGQTLVIDGWFASHADTGRPGPHVHLSTGGSSDMRGAVLQTSQIPDLIDRLNLVVERIDRQWAREGEEYLRTTFPADAPDDNDPEVVRQRRIDRLVLNEKLAAHISQVVDLVVRADDIPQATDSIAELLDVDPMIIEAHLLTFSLFGLTRAGRAAQARQLRKLREQM